jgi:hypothetical protein
MMKKLLIGTAMSLAMMAGAGAADLAPGAGAGGRVVVCARGEYRAGCVGQRGAVVVHRRHYYHRRAVIVR